MATAIKGKLTNIAFRFVWPVLPVAAKGALYRAHRRSIASRASVITK